MADTFNRLHIEQMTREWFGGPNPTVDGYLSCLRARLNRDLPSIDEAMAYVADLIVERDSLSGRLGFEKVLRRSFERQVNELKTENNSKLEETIQLNGDIRRLRSALSEVKLLALTAGASDEKTVAEALSRMVRIALDAGIQEKLNELRNTGVESTS